MPSRVLLFNWVAVRLAHVLQAPSLGFQGHWRPLLHQVACTSDLWLPRVMLQGPYTLWHLKTAYSQ